MATSPRQAETTEFPDVAGHYFDLGKGGTSSSHPQ